MTKQTNMNHPGYGAVHGRPSQYKKSPLFRVDTPAYMALDNKRNSHSGSHKYIYVQATIQTSTILLLALLLQERQLSDFKAT